MASPNKKTTTNSQKSGVKTAQAKKTSPTKPVILQQAEAEKDAYKLLQMFGIKTLHHSVRYHWTNMYYGLTNTSVGMNTYKLTHGATTAEDGSVLHLCPEFCERYNAYAIPVVYADDAGNVWASKINIRFDGVGPGASWNAGQYRQNATNLFKEAYADPFKVSNVFMYAPECLQSKSKLRNIIKNINPYAYKFVEDNGVEPINYLMAPYIELLSKAGYVFVESFFRREGHQKADVDYLNRLCKRGSCPADVFKTAKSVYKVLGPSEKDMRLWDTYRKLEKFGRITKESIRQTYDHAMPVKNLDLINNVLSQTHDGKPVFDWETLYHYLNRLDHYEAIDSTEALLLIRDYLSMCKQLNMKPRIDGDSLKREHDVAARLCRNMRQDLFRKTLEPACNRLKKYDYHEGVYFIRTITDFDDLLSEATQQHSCLVSYADDISKGRSKIFVMREVAHPERSLITVELSQDNKRINQALVAYNKQIRNKSQHDFLNRWLAYVRDVDKFSA